MQYLTSFELVLYASLISTFILFVIVIFQKRVKTLFKYIKQNFKIVFILAILNPFLYYFVLFKAYDLLYAQEAQAINYTWALTLAFLSAIFLKQKLTINDIIAGILCYFGVLIIATKGDIFSLNFSNIQGVFLALFSTVLWSMYWILNTKLKVEPIIGLCSNFLVSLPIIVIFFVFTQELRLIPIEGILSASYVGLFEMGITFLFWLKAMQNAVSTSKIANLIFLSPFISLVFIHFLLGEKIYFSTVIGLLIIIFGLLLQQYKNKLHNST